MPGASPSALQDILRGSSPVLLSQIQVALNNASRATAFRFLARVPYRRSYNYNGRYYAWIDSDRFDRFGLYSFDGVLFSLDGSLLRTVSRFVREAVAGYTQRELQDILKVRVRASLLQVCRQGHLARVKLEGVFVYFSQDKEVRDAQLAQRQQRIASTRTHKDTDIVAPVEDNVVIRVLLELIQHPEARPADVVRHLRGHVPPITLEQVEAVFTRFQLGEKKKGAHEYLSLFRRFAADAQWSAQEISRAAVRPGAGIPVVDFVAEAAVCPQCQGTLEVKKSKTRVVVTVAEGKFRAREIVKRCTDAACGVEVRSPVLAELVHKHQRYGYDLVVKAGLARYLDGKQREEVRAELREKHDIRISAGTVSHLCDRFLLSLEALHIRRAPALRAAMEGGYSLHLDATCESGKGGLFVCMAGWRNWVLWSTRIETENHVELGAAIDKTIELFGDPLATQRDMGEGVEKAVSVLEKRGVVDLICHYHFLSAVGEKLFNKAHTLLREKLRKLSIRTELRGMLRGVRRKAGKGSEDVELPATPFDSSTPEGPESKSCLGADTVGCPQRDQTQADVERKKEECSSNLPALLYWILEEDGSKEEVFPFSLPHLGFVQRCLLAPEKARQWLTNVPGKREQAFRLRLENMSRQLEQDPEVTKARNMLTKRWHTFVDLRDVLRLSKADLPRGDERHRQELLPIIELIQLREIEKGLSEYKKQLRTQREGTSASSPDEAGTGIVLEYLEKYGSKLFGHPAIRSAEGEILAVTQRTNNTAEHLFGDGKQALRRRVGRANLARDLQQQPSQVAYVHNLERPDYVRVLCGSLAELPGAFAALSPEALSLATPLVRDHRDSKLQQQVRRLLGNKSGQISSLIENGRVKAAQSAAPVVTVGSRGATAALSSSPVLAEDSEGATAVSLSSLIPAEGPSESKDEADTSKARVRAKEAGWHTSPVTGFRPNDSLPAFRSPSAGPITSNSSLVEPVVQPTAGATTRMTTAGKEPACPDLPTGDGRLWLRAKGTSTPLTPLSVPGSVTHPSAPDRSTDPQVRRGPLSFIRTIASRLLPKRTRETGSGMSP